MTIRCDHCAAPLPWDGGVAYSELPFDIASACEGESGVLCDICNDDFVAANKEDNEMDEAKSMWDEQELVQDLGIDVPFFVKFDIGAEDGTQFKHPTVQDVASIFQGGCDSGAWMPAVTYYSALRNLAENAIEIEDYLDEVGWGITKSTEDGIMTVACEMVSAAVEIWAAGVHQELVALGYEEAC